MTIKGRAFEYRNAVLKRKFNFGKVHAQTFHTVIEAVRRRIRVAGG